MFEQFKIIGVRDRYEDHQIFCQSVEELSNQERYQIAQSVLSAMVNNNQKEDLLNLLNYVSWPKLDKKFAEWGYLPALKASSIPEVTVIEGEGIFYGYNQFTPVKKDWSYQKALEADGPFFMRVEFSSKHPFTKARQAFRQKKEAEREAKAEKRRQKQIEKARKLLEQNE